MENINLPLKSPLLDQLSQSQQTVELNQIPASAWQGRDVAPSSSSAATLEKIAAFFPKELQGNVSAAYEFALTSLKAGPKKTAQKVLELSHYPVSETKLPFPVLIDNHNTTIYLVIPEIVQKGIEGNFQHAVQVKLTQNDSPQISKAGMLTKPIKLPLPQDNAEKKTKRERILKHMSWEKNLLIKLKGTHGIVDLKGWAKHSPNTEIKEYILIEELFEEGDLFNFIMDEHTAQIVTKAKLFEQVLEAVQRLHLNNIAHCDLKMENIVTRYQKDPEKKKIRNLELGLIDFGAACSLDEALSFISQGTAEYSSPEALSYIYSLAKQEYTPTGRGSDQWALGCLCDFLFNSRDPVWFNTIEEFKNLNAHLGVLYQQKVMLSTQPTAEVEAKQKLESEIVQCLKTLNEQKKELLVKLKNETSGKLNEHPKIQQLIQGLLGWNPEERLTLDQALKLTREIITEFESESGETNNNNNNNNNAKRKRSDLESQSPSKVG